MKPYYIFANWKLNLTRTDAIDWLVKFNEIYKPNGQIEIGIAPSYCEIPEVTEYIKNWQLDKSAQIFPSAQNVSQFPAGSYTGEISAAQLSEYQIKYCIVGHSERRNYNKETDSQINDKITRLYENDIIPLIAISNIDQVKALSEKVDPSKKHLIAYEPIENIGTGNPAQPAQVSEMITEIKSILQNALVLYGGSIAASNVTSFLQIEDLNGFLVGGASNKATDFNQLITKITNEI